MDWEIKQNEKTKRTCNKSVKYEKTNVTKNESTSFFAKLFNKNEFIFQLFPFRSIS